MKLYMGVKFMIDIALDNSQILDNLAVEYFCQL